MNDYQDFIDNEIITIKSVANTAMVYIEVGQVIDSSEMLNIFIKGRQ
ncbi:hypothetical protein TUM4438_11000 [Shewanella sairae]|uniref:Uncharacterized protein n=1 Tax=Shewanella sairae TaxID=190310 RepID=A0ABQ4P672_9GAMM|nr:hypothetical protein TUM4438_11000 [Shewanella sairae]